jgi:hypothetical protein
MVLRCCSFAVLQQIKVLQFRGVAVLQSKPNRIEQCGGRSSFLILIDSSTEYYISLPTLPAPSSSGTLFANQ